MRLLYSITCLLAGGLLASCANLNTLNRSSSLPGGGKGIHLDIHQRMVMVGDEGVYCTEPSPDALAATFVKPAIAPC